MCSNPNYALRLKTEFDKKFKYFKKRTQLHILGSVRDYEKGFKKLPSFDSSKYDLIMLECGKCKTCRFKKASRKAVQAQCESKLHTDNSFITLTFGHDKTYNYLRPKMTYYKATKKTAFLEWSLEKEEFQKFMKRLRWHVYQEDLKQYCLDNGYFNCVYKCDKSGSIKLDVNGCPIFRKRILKPDSLDDFHPRKIRVMHCGEYGSEKGRPHHHALIFGYEFKPDYTTCEFDFKTHKKHLVKHSKLLEDLWQFGLSSTDDVNYQTCNYVARYITKKVTGSGADCYYNGRKPEFVTQSNRPGLGFEYFVNNIDEIVNTGTIAIKTKKGIRHIGLPRYFRELHKRLRPDEYHQKVEDSIKKALEYKEKLVNVGLLSNLDSQAVIAEKVNNVLSRSFDDDINLFYDPDIHKTKVFNYIKDFNVLSRMNYKLFESKSTNQDILDNYRKFELQRKKDINSQFNVNLYEKIGAKGIISNINRILSRVNPYKVSKRGKNLEGICLSEDMSRVIKECFNYD